MYQILGNKSTVNAHKELWKIAKCTMKKDLCLVVHNNYIWRNNLKMTLQNLLKQIIYILWWLTVNFKLKDKYCQKWHFIEATDTYVSVKNLPHAGYQIGSLLIVTYFQEITLKRPNLSDLFSELNLGCKRKSGLLIS